MLGSQDCGIHPVYGVLRSNLELHALLIGSSPQPDNLSWLGQPFNLLLLTTESSSGLALLAIFMRLAITACQKWSDESCHRRPRARMCPPIASSVLWTAQQKDGGLICKAAICSICLKSTRTSLTLPELEVRFRISAFRLVFLSRVGSQFVLVLSHHAPILLAQKDQSSLLLSLWASFWQ